jgi:hypothetical protein
VEEHIHPLLEHLIGDLVVDVCSLEAGEVEGEGLWGLGLLFSGVFAF